MQSIILDNSQKLNYCETMLKQSPVDGSMTIEFKKTAMNSTAKQRRLQWKWYTEVANSGIGRADTKEGVHTRSKWQFARPILLRDDELFQIIFNQFIKTIQGSEIYEVLCEDFATRWISTESMTKTQRAEYLTDFQRYWVGKGVDLTDPATQGLDLSRFKRGN